MHRHNRLLAVPQTLEVKVQGKHSALEHAAEASLASKLPLPVDDLVAASSGNHGRARGDTNRGIRVGLMLVS